MSETRTDNLLRRALYRVNCPSGEELFLFRTKQLASGRMREIKAHVTTCSSCSQELALFNEPVFEPVLTGLDVDTSPSLIERLATYVAERLHIAPELRPALRGNRHTLGTFHVAERGWDITLEQVSQDAGFTIYGAIMAAEPIGPSFVTAWTPNGQTEPTIVTDAEIDDTGWFQLSGLEVGEYDLRIEGQGFRVDIPRIVIQPLNLE